MPNKPSWMSNIRRPSKEEVERFEKKDRTSEDLNVGARYVPVIETTKLNEKEYPGSFFRVRILPSLNTSPHPSFCFVVESLMLRDLDIGYNDPLHLPETLDPNYEKKNPVRIFQRELYMEDGSKAAREMALNLWPSQRSYMNCIIRKVDLFNEEREKEQFLNVGPRVFRATKGLSQYIFRSFKDPDLGDPTDPWEGFDLKIYMERREVLNEKTGKKNRYPQYDKSVFHGRPTQAGTEDEMNEWMSSMHDLTQEYKPMEDPDKTLADIASKLRDKYNGKLGNATSQGADLDNHDEVKSKSEEREERDQDVEKPVRPSTSDDDLEEVKPAKKAMPADDDERSEKKTAPSDDDDKRPEKKTAPADDDDEPKNKMDVRKSSASDERVASSSMDDDDDDEDDWLKSRVDAIRDPSKKKDAATSSDD